LFDNRSICCIAASTSGGGTTSGITTEPRSANLRSWSSLRRDMIKLSQHASTCGPSCGTARCGRFDQENATRPHMAREDDLHFLPAKAQASR